MYEIKGRNQRGQVESILVCEKGVKETIYFARNYFKEVKSIKFFDVLEDKNKN